MTKQQYAKRLESLGYNFSTLSDEHKAIINDCYQVQNEKVNIQDKVQRFKDQLTEFWKKDKKLYSKEMYVDFFEYWSEHGDSDRRFRKEKETSFCLSRRLKTWERNSKEFGKKNNKMPSEWSKSYENTLKTGQELQAYWKYLRANGWELMKVRSNTGYINKWIKTN